jgi:uncharacterized protein
MYPLVRYGFGIFLLLFFTAVCAQVEIPELSHRVTDITSTLSIQQATKLENRLAVFEAKKGSQIAVLIVPTTQPEDIAQFGIRVAEAWKIGRQNATTSSSIGMDFAIKPIPDTGIILFNI